MSKPSKSGNQTTKTPDPLPDDEYIIVDWLGCGRAVVRYMTGAWAGKTSTKEIEKENDRHDTEIQGIR